MYFCNFHSYNNFFNISFTYLGTFLQKAIGHILQKNPFSHFSYSSIKKKDSSCIATTAISVKRTFTIRFCYLLMNIITLLILRSNAYKFANTPRIAPKMEFSNVTTKKMIPSTRPAVAIPFFSL